MSLESGALSEWFIHSVSNMKLTQIDSVHQWLVDLRLMTETECMCVLQGKSLTKESTDLVFTNTKSAKESIDTLKSRAQIISSEFSKLFRKIEKERWRHVKSGALRVSCQIRSLLHECNTSIQEPNTQFMEQQQLVIEESAKMAQYVESHIEVNGHVPDKLSLIQLTTFLGESFSAMVDMALSVLLKNMLSNIEESTAPYNLKSVISHLVSLGLEGDHMCYLIAREGGVARLFEVCQLDSMQFAHSQALRAIATICCVPESIAELDKVGGVQCLTDILGSTHRPEVVKAEAAGVIAQITSPSVDQYHHLADFIENLEDLVKSLTELCAGTCSQEVFLLSCAALANITFMDSMACDFLIQYDTTQALIEACKQDKAHSLFAKDQVVTVLSNMAAVETYIPDITANKGTELLVHFLHERPPTLASLAELAACERIHQKSAIALTRLTKDVNVANKVIEIQGVPRLVYLCKNPSERNHSDAVLVACLAALRKISSITGEVAEFESEEIQQLITPRLMDSFLLCSGLDESVV